MHNLSFPSLVDVEQGIYFVTTKGRKSIDQLKRCSGLWQRIPRMGTVVAPLFGMTKWWAGRYLEPILMDAAVFYLEKMKEGLFRKKDEEALRLCASFLQNTRIPYSLQMFLSEELPSFWQKREFFRKECVRLGLKHENCAWQQNELFSVYCDRINQRLVPTVPQIEKLKVVEPVLETAKYVVSERALILFRKIRAEALKILPEAIATQQESVCHKKQCFLLRMESEALYEEAVRLEQRAMTLSIALEELIADEQVLSCIETKEEEEKALRRREEALSSYRAAQTSLVSELLVQKEELSRIKREGVFVLKECTKKLDAISRIEEESPLQHLQEEWIAKGYRSIQEYRTSLLRLPGVLFPVVKLKEYVEDITALCQAMYEENTRILSQK